MSTMSVDEWLKSDGVPTILFELSTVAERDDLVRVTPWLPEVGPFAILALDVPRASIAGVRPYAGGKAVCERLVDLDFSPGSALSLAELYRQLGDRLSDVGPAGAVILYPVLQGNVPLVRDFVPSATGLIAPKTM